MLGEPREVTRDRVREAKKRQKMATLRNLEIIVGMMGDTKALCSELRFRKSSSVANWHIKLRIPTQSKKLAGWWWSEQ